MSILEQIFEYPFLINILNNLLTDKDKLSLICNKFIYNNRLKFRFHNPTFCHKRSWKIWNYDLLTHVIVDDIFKFPKNVSHLKIMDQEFGIELEYGDIPNSVTHLHFYTNTEFILRENIIPNSVTHLFVDESYLLENIPKSVTHLQIEEFSGDFKIPQSITHLIINCLYFAQIIEIPDNVTHLEFGDQFDDNLENTIPNSAIHLTFGINFKSSFKNCIPNSVTHLTFKGIFKEKWIKLIPKTVEHLFVYNCKISSSNLFTIHNFEKECEKHELSIAGFVI